MSKKILSELYLFIIKLIITTVFLLAVISMSLFMARSHLSNYAYKIEQGIKLPIEMVEKALSEKIYDINSVKFRQLVSKLAAMDLEAVENKQLIEDIRKIRDNFHFILND